MTVTPLAGQFQAPGKSLFKDACWLLLHNTATYALARSVGENCTKPNPGGTKQFSFEVDPVLLVTTLVPHETHGSLFQPALYVFRGHTVILALAVA